MTRSKLSAVLSVLALLASSSPAVADIFAFTDERGVVHFTNMPNGDKRFKLIRKEDPVSGGAPTVGPARVGQLFMPAKADILRYSSMIESASKTHGVDSALVHAVITAESGYNPVAISKAGAIDVLRTTAEADVALICKETADGRYAVSTRSRGRTDVGAVCVSLGGDAALLLEPVWSPGVCERCDTAAPVTEVPALQEAPEPSNGR